MSKSEHPNDQRLWVTVALTLFGVALVVYGVLTKTWAAAAIGVPVLIVFGLVAANAKRASVRTGPVSASVDMVDAPVAESPPPLR